MKRSNTTHKLAAAIMAGAIVGSSSDSFAGNNTTLNNLTDNVVSSAAGIPNLISMVSYLCGIALAVAGIFKLKQHVDNPGQTPMKDGLIRLAAGGALLSFPFIAAMMQGSISDTGGVAVNMGDLTAMSGTDGFVAP